MAERESYKEKKIEITIGFAMLFVLTNLYFRSAKYRLLKEALFKVVKPKRDSDANNQQNNNNALKLCGKCSKKIITQYSFTNTCNVTHPSFLGSLKNTIKPDLSSYNHQITNHIK